MTASEPTRFGSDNSTSPRQERPEEALGLDPDEQAVLRYVRRHEPVTRDELAYQSRLPIQRVDRILRVLEAHDLASVDVGFTRTTIRPLQDGDQR